MVNYTGHLEGVKAHSNQPTVAKVLTLKADVIWTQITKPLKAPLAGAFL